MPVPDYQSIMLPLLKAVSNGKEFKFREIVEVLAVEFELTEEERRELLPSGTQFLFDNRVGWANTYLKKSGLLQSEKRGFVQITDLGQQVLRTNPRMINASYLRQFDSFNQFIGYPSSSRGQVSDLTVDLPQTPEETLEGIWTNLNRTLATELLQKVRHIDPSQFEKLVVDLLLAMGYGGSRQEAGSIVGKSGDGGIDGIIKEDRLGLDKIYVQAKRWENTVPIKEVRDFAGALMAQKAHKGVFITTSDFPKSAYEFVQNIDRTIVLIDGLRLAELMIEFEMGVSVKETYRIKEIDLDYFEV